MFSFGIFTTHIPYIVFAVFYAYFLLFGLEQASNGKIQSNDNHFLNELQVESYFAATDFQNSFSSKTAEFHQQSEFEPFIFKRAVKLRLNKSTPIIKIGVLSPFSNRPPPCFS